MIDNTLLMHCKEDFDLKLPTYEKMQRYYDGDTDAMASYKMITDRSNLKISNNYIQKFTDEEANYCCANKVTYTSHSNNSNVVESIRTNFKHWKESYNKDLLEQALIFQEAYELYYIDSNGLFSSLICTPLNSYILQDDFGNVHLFIRFFTKKFDDTKTLYADVYTDTDITHYTVSGTSFLQIPNSKIDQNIFNKVPVGIVDLGNITKSFYCKLHGLQEGYETNLSDSVNMNSDFRQSYLLLKGCQLKPEDAALMKEKGIIDNVPSNGDAKWLERQEGGFDKTLTTLQDNIYQQANHINWNTKLQSNTSSLALKNQMIGLNQKVSNNIQALEDCIKTRLQFLFEYILIKTGTSFDYKDIDIHFTPNVPSDDMLMAQIVSQLKGVLPIQEGLKLFSFIDNPQKVYEELKQEQKENSINLDNVPDDSGGAAVNE